MSISESTAAQVPTGQIMHALRLHERGGPERLVYEAAPMPPVALGDHLIKVLAWYDNQWGYSRCIAGVTHFTAQKL